MVKIVCQSLVVKRGIAIMFTIRPFKEEDSEYEAVIVVENAVWPDYPGTIEEWKHRDNTRDPKYLFRRLVIEVEGKIVAHGIYCEPWWSIKPGKYYINLSVHPDYQRQGIGTALYNYVMDILAEHDPVKLISDTREDKSDAVRFLTKRGFKQVMREPVSHLDVVNFDPTRFADIPAQMDVLGIRIQSLAEIQSIDPDWKHKLWGLEWELLQDVPTTDPLTRQTFVNFEKQELGSPGFNANAQFIATHSAQWVGLSALSMALAEPEKLYTGLTGVVRNYRRKGIATALKLRAINFARRYGAKVIETDNEENNPMYGLNLKLGFKPRPAWLQFEKKLRETAEESGE